MASVGGAHYAGQIFELVPDANHTTWIYQALYDFCSAYKCADGGFPGASPLTYAGASTGKPYDGKSPLFGTTAGGNTNGGGVAYEIQPSGGGWSEKVLYSFCAADNCTDGYAPDAPLFVVSNKRVIGTTFEGGLCMPGCGTVFELDAGKTTWTQSLLHEFCSEDNCADGTEPEAGVVMDAEGDLFGVTLLGGNSCDLFYGIYSCGVAYKLTSSKEGWTETVVHAFCAKPGCADGALPEATPVTDGSGNVWGTAPDGGDTTFDSTGGGTVFEITGGLTFATRYKFCPHADCPKGAGPVAPLLASKKGELFGTALRGGNGGTGGNDGGGVVYELKP